MQAVALEEYSQSAAPMIPPERKNTHHPSEVRVLEMKTKDQQIHLRSKGLDRRPLYSR